MQGFGLQIKPAGNNCNLRCKYCYAAPFAKSCIKIMPLDILETAIRKNLAFQGSVFFSWHGGEPLLAGIDFFKKAVEFIDKYKNSEHIVTNMVQTNATLITPEFARFFKDNGITVSVSIDGPEFLHNLNRVDHAGIGSFSNVMRGVKYLRDVGLQPPVIATITQDSIKYGKEIFDFLVTSGFTDIKFSPVYDSCSDNFSVSSDDWFYFLKDVLHAWFEHGDTSVKVREIDEVVAWLSNKTMNLCASKHSCLSWISIDPDGNIYPCEYLRSEMPYGNILDMDLADVYKTASYARFKKLFLHKPEKCQKCRFWDLCGNGCPATRVKDGLMTHDGVYVYCEERIKLFNELKNILES